MLSRLYVTRTRVLWVCHPVVYVKVRVWVVAWRSVVSTVGTVNLTTSFIGPDGSRVNCSLLVRDALKQSAHQALENTRIAFADIEQSSRSGVNHRDLSAAQLRGGIAALGVDPSLRIFNACHNERKDLAKR
jgi:hypothetical protein